MDILGEHRDGGPGVGGGGLVLQQTGYGTLTGGAGTWSQGGPSLPFGPTDGTPTIDIATLAADASGNGTMEIVFSASGSPTGNLNWSLDTTQFISPTTFGPPDEWTASITASDPTSPGTATLQLGMTSTDAFEAGLILGMLVDDGVNPPIGIYYTLNHTESP